MARSQVALVAVALALGCSGHHSSGPAVATIEITPSPASVVVGHALSVSAQAKDANGAPVPGTVAWQTADPLVATVSTSGEVSALAAGTTTISASQGGKSASASLTVQPGTLDLRGVWAAFEDTSQTIGFYNGDVIKNFDTLQPALSSQMDLMAGMGVNTISFTIAATDSSFTGQFTPPDCNMPPVLGALWPQPTATELTDLVKVLDLAQAKGLHVLLNLISTHMEENPPTNATTWLTALVNDVKSHPALELVTFMGDVHINDFGGTQTCGIPAEPPLWLGPNDAVYKHVKFEMSLARSLGLDPRKISVEAIVGDYNLESQAAQNSPGLYSPIAMEKQLFDELSWPAAQRTYALSFYFRNKCDVTTACTEIGPAAWADDTMRYVSSVVDYPSGARAVAIEWGTLVGGGSTPASAVPGITAVMRKYGVSGGSYWTWVETDDSYEASLPFAEAVVKRGSSIQFNPVQGDLATAYAAP